MLSSGINRATNDGGIDVWYAAKGGSVPPEGTKVKWHFPSQAEIKLAEELVNLHLRDSLRDLRNICQDGPQTGISGRFSPVGSCLQALSVLRS